MSNCSFISLTLLSHSKYHQSLVLPDIAGYLQRCRFIVIFFPHEHSYRWIRARCNLYELILFVGSKPVQAVGYRCSFSDGSKCLSLFFGLFPIRGRRIDCPISTLSGLVRFLYCIEMPKTMRVKERSVLSSYHRAYAARMLCWVYCSNS